MSVVRVQLTEEFEYAGRVSGTGALDFLQLAVDVLEVATARGVHLL